MEGETYVLELRDGYSIRIGGEELVFLPSGLSKKETVDRLLERLQTVCNVIRSEAYEEGYGDGEKKDLVEIVEQYKIESRKTNSQTAHTLVLMVMQGFTEYIKKIGENKENGRS